jgi:hypothetical protein
MNSHNQQNALKPITVRFITQTNSSANSIRNADVTTASSNERKSMNEGRESDRKFRNKTI